MTEIIFTSDPDINKLIIALIGGISFSLFMLGWAFRDMRKGRHKNIISLSIMIFIFMFSLLLVKLGFYFPLFIGFLGIYEFYKIFYPKRWD